MKAQITLLIGSVIIMGGLFFWFSVGLNELNKIFDPLFTTKQKGTGLGLASVKNIIEQHNGTINVKNNPTTFIIKLPKKEELS